VLGGKSFLAVLPQHIPVTQQPTSVTGRIGPNRNHGVLTFDDIKRPIRGETTLTGANRINHDFPPTNPPRAPHSDYFIGILKVPSVGNATITVLGRHVGLQVPFEASFVNFSSEPLTGSYIPSYGTRADGRPITGDPIPFGTVQPGKSAEKKKLPLKDGTAPKDYDVTVSGSVTTETTLAFLGTDEGSSGVTELDLAALTEMLTGASGYLAPMLRDVSLDTQLFVFVNLLQWVGSDATFSALQTYDLTGGTNDLLPGFFVSTTPITLSANGMPQGTPFTGQVFAAGGIDGEIAAVPEPSTLALAGMAVLSLAGYGAITRRIRRWATPRCG
jgi:hypothetical protein